MTAKYFKTLLGLSLFWACSEQQTTPEEINNTGSRGAINNYLASLTRATFARQEQANNLFFKKILATAGKMDNLPIPEDFDLIVADDVSSNASLSTGYEFLDILASEPSSSGYVSLETQSLSTGYEFLEILGSESSSSGYGSFVSGPVVNEQVVEIANMADFGVEEILEPLSEAEVSAFYEMWQFVANLLEDVAIDVLIPLKKNPQKFNPFTHTDTVPDDIDFLKSTYARYKECEDITSNFIYQHTFLFTPQNISLAPKLPLSLRIQDSNVFIGRQDLQWSHYYCNKIALKVSASNAKDFIKELPVYTSFPITFSKTKLPFGEYTFELDWAHADGQFAGTSAAKKLIFNKYPQQGSDFRVAVFEKKKNSDKYQLVRPINNAVFPVSQSSDLRMVLLQKDTIRLIASNLVDWALMIPKMDYFKKFDQPISPRGIEFSVGKLFNYQQMQKKNYANNLALYLFTKYAATNPMKEELSIFLRAVIEVEKNYQELKSSIPPSVYDKFNSAWMLNLQANGYSLTQVRQHLNDFIRDTDWLKRYQQDIVMANLIIQSRNEKKALKNMLFLIQPD